MPTGNRTERTCPKCGTIFASVQDLGQCPKCRHAFHASGPSQGPPGEVIDGEDVRTLLRGFGYGLTDFRLASPPSVEDVATLLAESAFGLVVDWRSETNEAVANLARVVKQFDVLIEYEGDECEGSVAVTSSGKTVRGKVRYVPNEDDQFDAVVKVVCRAAPTLRAFSLKPLEDSDAYHYVFLSAVMWAKLARELPALATLFLREIGRR